MARPKRKTLPKDFEDLLVAGDIGALKAVFDSCDVNARGGVFKQTALAFSECPDALARWLVERGADLTAGDSYGETPLHSRAGHWKGSVEVLIELGADVNHDAGGRATPLHRAAATGNLDAAQVLLHHGARPDVTNRNGQAPLVFALQRCSNATIDRMAPMAELLLGAMAAPPEKSRSFIGRVFADSTARGSPVTPEMQELVQQIGTQFEFNRSGFDSDSVEATSHALDQLYTLFDVHPVPRRALHDGKSPIVVRPGRWEDQHQELWESLVPSAGPSATVQGEVIRISGRIKDELERNGGVNWNNDYRKMADAFLGHVGSAQPLSVPDLDLARQTVSEVKNRQDGAAELCKLAVRWVALNPRPIGLSEPDYQR